MMIRFFKMTEPAEKVTKAPIAIKDFDGSALSLDKYDTIIQVPLSSNLQECNYCYIKEYGLYYFAKPQIINNSIIEFSLHCDVLTSFQDQIKQLEAVIERQEFAYNLYQADSEIPLYCNKNVQVLKSKVSLPLTPSYILITAG